jgi:hypothetical protein
MILCVLSGREARLVEKRTGSKYTHAGICYSPTEIVEVTLDGIRKTSVEGFVSECVHAAVFRNPVVWTHNRIGRLQHFLDDLIGKQATYNLDGAHTLRSRQHDHQLTLLAKVKAYFVDGLEPEPHKKLEYFCSELVAACFVEVGFITPAAAVAFQSDTYSAGDLGKESVFGFFVGYLKPTPDTVIPVDDEYANRVTLSEINLAQEDT